MVRLRTVSLATAAAALVACATPAIARTASERLDALDARITRLEDMNAIERLQKTYGYFVDEGQWTRLPRHRHPLE